MLLRHIHSQASKLHAGRGITWKKTLPERACQGTGKQQDEKHYFDFLHQAREIPGAAKQPERGLPEHQKQNDNHTEQNMPGPEEDFAPGGIFSQRKT